MIKVLLLVLLGAVLTVLGIAAMKPDRFRVQRSTRIRASRETLFDWISDLHRWESWSPWQGKDPAMRTTYSGPDRGVGAAQAWVGNNQVGEGRMEIIEAVAGEKVAIQLDFLRPFEAHNRAEFTLEEMGEDTMVTWAMTGPSPFPSKVMQVFMSMDAMVGTDFEAGLANLKRVAEQS